MTDSGPDFDLTEAANRYRISDGDVEGVIATARRRTRRKRQALSVTVVVALVASVPVAQRVMAPSDDGTPVAAASAPVQRGSLGLKWRRVEPKASVGYARGLSTQGPLYAVSSAPGERSVQNQQLSRVVWRSDDGVEWTTASTLGPDLYLSDLSARDSRVYAVGTAPAEAVPPGRPPMLRSSDLVVGWSDDGARYWQTKKLPLDLPRNVPTRVGSIASAQVASGPQGTVAVVVLHAELDVPAVLPDGATAPHGWATTDTGVDVLGPERGVRCPDGFDNPDKETGSQPPSEVMPTWCQNGTATVVLSPQQTRAVVASYTWEQLGVGGDLLRAVRQQPIAFFARPGSTEFQPVELPGSDRASSVALDATEAGFDLMATTGDRYGRDGKVMLLQSGDGQSWTKAALAGGPRYPAGLGVLGGRTAFVTAAEKGGTFTVADGDGGWKSVSLADVVDPEVLDGRLAGVTTVAFGSFGVAIGAVLHPSRGDYNESQVSHRLLVSRDGVTWDDIPMEELTGTTRGFVTRITITGADIVVTAQQPATQKASGPQRQVVVVGTAS